MEGHGRAWKGAVWGEAYLLADLAGEAAGENEHNDAEGEIVHEGDRRVRLLGVEDHKAKA